MKTTKYTIGAFAAAVLGACSSIDEVEPQGGTLLDSQVKESTAAIPARADATYSGMYTKLGQPCSTITNRERPDDFGFIMMALSGDIEAADVLLADNGYNWFSVCGTLETRNADYANPYIRYAAAYNEISAANDVISSYPADAADAEYKIAQAKAIRAFSYLNLAPYFQFNYATSADKPCVPLVTEKEIDFTNNPRASVADVYKQILEDLDYAVEHLDGYVRPDKSKIDRQVALGLRARAYLNMGKYAEAAADAAAAAEGYTPASIAEVSVPSFYNLAEHNWLWGYDATIGIVSGDTEPNATSSSWVRSFSGNGYAPFCQLYARCNTLLYNKISDTDVRKGWWVDEKLESPLLDKVTWDGKSGVDLANLKINDVKEPFLPYTNVKFGMYTIGGTTNEEDWPFMRVEEMLLIQAEALYLSGNEAEGKKVLTDFVKTYRDPQYNPDASGRDFVDEVWFQRRVELWGEGFSNPDTRRLGKPLVRFHEGDKSSNVPDNFKFNMTADDGWWLMRFTTSELNTNFGIVDNAGGSLPVMGQHGELRDGVTD